MVADGDGGRWWCAGGYDRLCIWQVDVAGGGMQMVVVTGGYDK